ncbi:ribonuclease Oy-like [Calliopsis andreniformis]|uniref:ribonuclease Oy-like n=1 Tax=Calliopsis andreniformis TaxID=337506 RepID=UPI003FCCED91
MFSRRISLLLFLLAVFNRHAIGRSSNFDIIIFTQRWPATICHLWQENSPWHQCALPSDINEWTIHGIWPSQYHKIGPLFCNPSLPFSISALKPIEGQLKEKWIDIEYGRDSYSLWQHEWEKHGTCAAVLEPMSTEIKYFQKGVSLLKQYDMKNVLSQANIVPGNSYAVTDILNAIQEVLGKRGMVVCRKDKSSGQSYIMEVRVCLNKALELIDCDDAYEYPTNCNTYESVVYPSRSDYYSVQQT